MASAVVGTLRVLLEVNASHLEREFGKATIKIGEFDKFTQNAGRGLQRMVEQFSGQRIVAEAARMAAAVERVGGVSSLTERELRRVAGTVTEATAKLRAMGADVPESIAKLQTEIGTLGTKSVTTAGSVGRLANSLNLLGIGLSAAAVVQFGRQILADADAVTKLADKTGIAVEAVQRLKFIAEQSGNTLDQVTGAITQMQNRLAEGDKSAVGALHQLGLSLDMLRNLAPDQQFMAIAREVAAIENPMERTRIAMDLFGRAGAEILPTMVADMQKLGDEAPVMSEKAVAAFDAIGDAINRMWTRAKSATGEGLAAAIDGYTRLIDLSRALMTGEFARVPEILLQLESVSPSIAAPANAFLEAVQANAKGVALSMEEIGRISKQLDADFKKSQQAAEAFGKAQDALFGRDLIAKANDYARQLGDVSNVTKLTAEKKAELHRAVTQALEAYQLLGQTAPQVLRDIQAATLPVIQATRQFHRTFVELAAAVRDAGRELQNIGQGLTGEGLLRGTDIATAGAEGAAAMKELHDWAQRTGAVFPAAMQDSREAIREATAATVTLGQTLKTNLIAVLQNIPNLLTAAFTGGGGFSGALKGLGVQLAQGIAAPLAQSLGKTISTSLFGSATGIAGAIGSSLATFGISAAVIGVGMLAQKWFGVSKEIKQARKEVDDFQAKLHQTLNEQQKIEAAGRPWAATVIAVRDAYLATGRSAAEAEAIVKQLWDTDHPDRARRAMEQINLVMREFGERAKEAEGIFDDIMAAAEEAGGTIPAHMRPVIQQLLDMGLLTDDMAARLRGLKDESEFDWKAMQAAGERYGDWMRTEMGQAFQQARLHDGAVQIINDFDRLTRGGASVGSVLFGMREEIGRLVQESLQFGTKLPANMRPWIQELVRSGNLLDDHGEKITDISELQFGEEIKTEAEIAKEGWDKIIAKIDELIRKITGPLQDAIDRVPNEVPVNFVGTFTPPTTTQPDGEPVPMATGGLVTRPTLALLGEAGPELVMPLRARTRIDDSVLRGIGAITVPEFPAFTPGEVGGRIDDEAHERGLLAQRLEELTRRFDRFASGFDRFTDVLPMVMRDAVLGAV